MLSNLKLILIGLFVFAIIFLINGCANQPRALAEEVNRLNDVLTYAQAQAFGERADACMAIDGGNL